MTNDTDTAAAPSGMLDKIQKLLAQATHANTSEEEAQAFFAKAYQLMAKWSIDETILSMNRPDRSHEEITTEYIDNIPWIFYKRRHMIWHIVALHNHCHAVGEPRRNAESYKYDSATGKQRKQTRPGKIRLVGFPSDLTRVKMLALSLEMHALSKAPTGYYRKQSFLDGFIGVLSMRMQRAYAAAKADGEARAPGVGLAIIDRDKQVKQHIDRNFGKLNKSIVRGSKNDDAHAYRAGQAEAAKADIGQTGVGSQGATAPSRQAISGG